MHARLPSECVLACSQGEAAAAQVPAAGPLQVTGRMTRNVLLSTGKLGEFDTFMHAQRCKLQSTLHIWLVDQDGYQNTALVVKLPAAAL